MRRFAQFLNGEVIDIQEAESKAQLATAFGPETYWVDVTNVDCEVGYVARFFENAGIIYVNPADSVKEEEIIDVEDAKHYRLEYIKRKYKKERDKIRWVVMQEENVNENDIVVTNKVQYGFDCTPQSIINFMAAMMTMLLPNTNSNQSVDVIGYLETHKRGIINLKLDQLAHIYETIRNEQLLINTKYHEIKDKMLSLNSIEEIMKVDWNDEENVKG